MLAQPLQFRDTNELLKSLARDSVEPDALISLVRSGKVEGVKLEYNQSDGGWAVSEYDDYFKKWFTTFFEGSMADLSPVIRVEGKVNT